MTPESTPAALAGGTAPDIAVPTLPSAGPAESAGHSVHLLPTQTHPRYLTFVKDSQQPNWWYAYLCDRDQHPLVYCSSWTAPPRIVRMSTCIVLRLDNAQLDISKEEVELLRPLTAHGLVIEEATP